MKPVPSNEETTSLNKWISSKGYCSRREADRIIADGRVTINGTVAVKGNRVAEGDEVLIDGKSLDAKPDKVYMLFNKPVGIICTTDRKEKDNIVDYINYPERIFHVGRLDKPSQGLIIMTNDGDIVNDILRARYEHEKEYVVRVNKPITKQFIKGMSGGVPILDTVTKECFVEQDTKFQFRIILTQGLNRQIRRMCEHFGYRVTFLKRVRIMHFKLGHLKPGQWRYMNKQELQLLQKEIRKNRKKP